MDIRIKTHDEFRKDRVTIEIVGTGAEIREVVNPNYPSELDWTAVRAERDLLREKLARAEVKIRDYDLDRHTEKERADQLSNRVVELGLKIEQAAEILSARQVDEVRNSAVTTKETYLSDVIQDALNTLA